MISKLEPLFSGMCYHSVPVNAIQNAALAVGLTVTRRASVADVLDLIKKLRPVDCGCELIRVGGDADGGYLIPDDLEGVHYCFSPGVGSQATFEIDVASRGIRSFLADYSVDCAPVQGDSFIFDKKNLGSADTENSFTLDSWMNKYLPYTENSLLLQMDIEGFEYEVICSTPPEVLNRFRIMVIEFHYLDRFFDDFVRTAVFRPCFEKLLARFHIAHIHPNNCCGSVRSNGLEIPKIMEFTFYNKHSAGSVRPRRDFPHSLDRENVPSKGPLRLPSIWHTQGKD